MKILLVTEKNRPSVQQRDGGSRVVETIKEAFSESLTILQFSQGDYPYNCENRFERRVKNARFIAEKVKAREEEFTHIIFLHISMQFGLIDLPLRDGVKIWTFPMFLTPSYEASGELVPQYYLEKERAVLRNATNILTPSYLEKEQLITFYGVAKECIHVVPRGVVTEFLPPIVRECDSSLKICSVGSIKPQKNTLGLVRLFAKICRRFPGATLQIIGPCQDRSYGENVIAEIEKLGLQESVALHGYVSPENLAESLKEAHLHLSSSTCETFGRAIFETLALGLPNIARLQNNAAANFLEGAPYAKFVDEDDAALAAIEEILRNLSQLSLLATEVGKLYNDCTLGRMMRSIILRSETLAISDYDGTLFHKEDEGKTARCIAAFRKYSKRVICTARPIPDVLKQLAAYDLHVDYIIGYSGSVVTCGLGNPLFIHPLKREEIAHIEGLLKESEKVTFQENILQIMTSQAEIKDLFLRVERYQKSAFIAAWEASKFRALSRLLETINWRGRVRVFGDGQYDREMINYFDGRFITSSPSHYREIEEVEYEEELL